MKLRSALLLIISCAVLLSAQAPEVEITAEPHHHLALQNPFVRVFKVELAPQAATLMHRHRHDYVFVTLGPSEVENDVQGKPSATLKLKDGDTYFLPGGFAHIAKNLSGQPFRNVTIEFMRTKKRANLLRPSGTKSAACTSSKAAPRIFSLSKTVSALRKSSSNPERRFPSIITRVHTSWSQSAISKFVAMSLVRAPCRDISNPAT